MEGLPEQQKDPEIKTEELLDIVENMEWESGHVFGYNGSEYVLILDREGEPNPVHEGGESHPSTMITGWDIYVLETLPETERKRRLFHQILETNFRDQGFAKDESFQIAQQEEEKQFGPRK